MVAPNNLTEHFLSVPLDHAAPWKNDSLRMRYLMDVTHLSPGGPLVVYTGNEGDIEGFAAACGFLWIIAERFGGAVIFLEERYYGKSLPVARPVAATTTATATGSSAGTGTLPPFAFLSSVQVVADYAFALGRLRVELNSTRVLAVGGSYGGMLAAWLRKQHPDLVDAALASSAPVLGYASTLVEQQRDGGFWSVTERGYSCRDSLGAAFRALWAASPADWDSLSADFGLCSQSRVRNVAGLETLIGFLQQQLSALAFGNYPYPVGSMPANPTSYACAAIPPANFTSDSGFDEGGMPAASGWLPLRDALAWHYQKKGECLELESSFAAYSPGFLPGAWTFQRCTDLIMAFSVASDSRMFLPCSEGFRPNCAADGQTALRTFCQETFGVSVPDAAALQTFWGSDWSALGGGSRIVFSNGDLDPWRYGGVLDDVSGGSDGPVTIHIASAAHHLDLRGPTTDDPPAVVAAREQEAAILGRWLGLADGRAGGAPSRGAGRGAPWRSEGGWSPPRR